MLQKGNTANRIYLWVVNHLTNRQLMGLLAALVGLAAGFAAVILKYMVHFISHGLHSFSFDDYYNYIYIISPVVGIFLTIIFIRYILRKSVGHGVPGILHAISRNNGYLEKHKTFSSLITSTFTVGFGGSVGLEGPIVGTGAAIGSNVGRLFKLNRKQIVTLIGCASSGAVAAIFNAPIAGIVFSLEILMLDLTFSSLIPLLIASASAVVTSYFFMGNDILYTFNVDTTFELIDLLYYVFLGIFAGLISVFFARVYLFMDHRFERIRNAYSRLLLGGLILGLLVFMFPSLYGEGYNEINSCLSGDVNYLFNRSFFYGMQDEIWVVILLLLGVTLLKVFATASTFGAGGVGGIFAPALFIGANAGMVFSKMANILGLHELSERNFALVGMAGLIAGILHAPLFAIFLIADISGGYNLFVPLMITSIFSYVIVKYFQPNSVYTYQLAQRKELITHDKDKSVLNMMSIDVLIETNFKTVLADATLRDFLEIVTQSQRNVFPVVDEENNLQGIVFINDIRHIILKRELYDKVRMRDLMYMPSPLVNPDESMEEVAKKFQNSSHYNIPVVKDGKYVGFISRANMFSTYRKILQDFSEE
jgi:CIC family chloride channel protein